MKGDSERQLPSGSKVQGEVKIKKRPHLCPSVTEAKKNTLR